MQTLLIGEDTRLQLHGVEVPPLLQYGALFSMTLSAQDVREHRKRFRSGPARLCREDNKVLGVWLFKTCRNGTLTEVTGRLASSRYTLPVVERLAAQKQPGWIPAALHPQEEARVASLQESGLLERPPASTFDAITDGLREALGVSVVFVTLIDDKEQTYPSCSGADVEGGAPRDAAVCSHTLLNQGPLMVPDMRLDPRFATSPPVALAGGVAYAGVPLRDEAGLPVGTLCLVDSKPRTLNEEEVACMLEHACRAEAAVRNTYRAAAA